MQILKLVALALSSALIFTSCKELKGTFSTNAPITVQKDNKTYVIPAGSSQVEIKVKNENTIQFKVKTTAGEKDIKVNTNFNAKQLQNGQTIDIPASITGQGFGVQGVFYDVTNNSEMRSSFESCDYYRTERRCYYNSRNQYFCDTYQVPYNGNRHVSYYDADRTVTLKLDVIVNGQKSGQIDSSNTESTRVYTDQGMCY